MLLFENVWVERKFGHHKKIKIEIRNSLNTDTRAFLMIIEKWIKKQEVTLEFKVL